MLPILVNMNIFALVMAYDLLGDALRDGKGIGDPRQVSLRHAANEESLRLPKVQGSKDEFPTDSPMRLEPWGRGAGE